MAQAIALPLWAAWIADFVKRGKQRTKWHQSNLHLTRMSLQQSRHRTVQLSTSGGRLRPVPQNCMTLGAWLGWRAAATGRARRIGSCPGSHLASHGLRQYHDQYPAHEYRGAADRS